MDAKEANLRVGFLFGRGLFRGVSLKGILLK